MQATNSLLYVISYVLLFGFSWMCKIKGIHRLINDDGGFTQKPKGLISAHIIGIIWLGLVPVIVLKQSILQVLTEIKMPVSFIIVLYFFLLILIITIAFEQSKKAYEKSQSSSESFARLSLKFFNSYFIVRALFLFSYELWFRGFLLFDCIHWFGIPLAVLINVTLYVLVHIFNGKKEALACIPFGLIVCFFSIYFNSVLPAILLHIGFSLAYEYNFYRLNLINSKTAKS
ncbi:MAG: CPBP family intramembrane metalloprotease [Lentimicrobium sp.]|jgi:membrane protease YdiL (CAAX protease family)|nr:CPBP family intramembrane metalloprotease [Lentimicrobium sp.]